MSFALVHQNKAADSRSLTPARPSSTHHRANNLTRDFNKSLLHLQPIMGNQAVQRLMRSNASGFDFAKIGIIHPKLRVSQPQDIYEQEADRVAEQVMRMPVSSDSVMPIGTAKDEEIDSKCAACERKEKEDEKQLNISRKPSTASILEANDEIAGNINNLRSSGGSPLDTSTRHFMESRFGYEFGDVRVHTDGQAAESARAVDALAYTVGHDIVFSAGQYMPKTIEGRKLLAHELTHVVQQGRLDEGIQRLQFLDGASVDRGEREIEVQAADSVQQRLGLTMLQRQADIAQAPPGLLDTCDALATEPGHIPGTDVFFSFSSSTLTASQKADIASFVSSWVDDGSNDDVVVDGFASVEGPQALNWRLSCERAEAVKTELIVQGVPAAMITTVAHGESNEFSTTTLEPNRRAIITKQTSLEATAAPTPTIPRLEEVSPEPAGGGTKAKGGASKDSICKDLCGKGKLPLFGLVSKHGGTFAVCSLDQKFDQTNPAARPRLTGGMVLKDIPATDIEFTTNSKDATWQFQAGVTACLPDTVPDDDWDYGFIQSVESLRFDAEYTLDWSAQRVVAAPSRDANPSSTDKPWINPPGTASGPVKFETRPAMLVDRPGARFPMFVGVPGIFSGTIPPEMHKTAKVTPCAGIRSIGCEGVFNIWLVVKRTGFDELAFLSNTRISLSQLVKRDMVKDPDDSTAWGIASSGGSMDKMSGGKGPKNPVLETPIANKFLHFLLVFMGNPCPIRL